MRTLFLALATSATIFATGVTPVAAAASIGIACKATTMLARAIVDSPATCNVRLAASGRTAYCVANPYLAAANPYLANAAVRTIPAKPRRR